MPRFDALDALVKETLASAGDGIVAYIEGDSDYSVLNRFLSRHRTDAPVTFMVRGGKVAVRREIRRIVSRFERNELYRRLEDRLFGIVDRDFAEDDIIETCYQANFENHIYVLRRSCIENYLLEPEGILSALEATYRRERLPTWSQSPDEIYAKLKSWGEALAPEVAGNWVMSDLFSQVAPMNDFRELPGQAPTSKDVLEKLVRHYTEQRETISNLLDEHQIREKFMSRLNMIRSSFQTPSGLHKHISGKLLLKALCQELPGSLGWEKMADQLIKSSHTTLPDDISLIFKSMLSRWQHTYQQRFR
jgi:hypothetical protein